MGIRLFKTKKGDVTKCTHTRTIALFPHTNTILLSIIRKQLQIYIYIYTQYERAMEEAGLRGGHGASKQIATVSESWRVQGSTTIHQTVL